MPAPIEINNQDLLICIRGTKRLHELYLLGQNDSPEADRIRDVMDGPWARLSDQERLELDALSVRLYEKSERAPSLGALPHQTNVTDSTSIPS